MFRIQALRGKGRIRYVSRWRTASVLVSDLDDRRKRSNHCLLINTSQRYQNVRCLHGVGKNYYCNLDRSSSSSSSAAAAAAAASSSSSSDYGNNDQTAFTSTRFTPVSSHFLLSRASNLLTYPQIPSFHFNLTACPNLTTISIKSFSTKPTTNTNTATNHTTTTGTTTTTTKLTKKKSKSGKKVKKISRTPSWLNEEQAATHETILRAVKNVPKQLWNVTIKCIKWTLKCIRNPSYFKETMSDIWAHTKSEFQRYKLGTKLLVADIKVASNIIKRVLQGYSLSRRERKQLKITAMDILRVGPLFMFIIIPGMEFALPFAVKTFPNMLPSTFRETLKTQEDKKKLLRARIEMTAFFQDTMREFAEESKRKAKGRQKQLQRLAEEKKRELLEREQEEEDYVYHPPTIDGKDQEKVTIELNRASKLLDSIDKIREGAAVDVDTIIEMSQLFKDGITLDTVSRSHLVAMCKYMGLNAFGSDPYLRYQLRSAIRGIRKFLFLYKNKILFYLKSHFFITIIIL
jgi:LETM1 and EF-hand domain-containing protein 1